MPPPSCSVCLCLFPYRVSMYGGNGGGLLDGAGGGLPWLWVSLGQKKMLVLSSWGHQRHFLGHSGWGRGSGGCPLRPGSIPPPPSGCLCAEGSAWGPWILFCFVGQGAEGAAERDLVSSPLEIHGFPPHWKSMDPLLLWGRMGRGGAQQGNRRDQVWFPPQWP